MYLLPGDIANSHLFMISLDGQLRGSASSPRGRSQLLDGAEGCDGGKDKGHVLRAMKATAAVPALPSCSGVLGASNLWFLLFLKRIYGSGMGARGPTGSGMVSEEDIASLVVDQQ